MVNDAVPLRIAFFGTPEFASPTLHALLASRHDVAVVVTQPDRPRGRGQRLHEPPVKTIASAHHVQVLQPDDLRATGFHDAFRAIGADLAVVAAYGRILPEALLAIPRLGFVNVHASLLPRYRGAAPVHRAVMAGEGVTGVTIMRVVRALDAGPMLSVVSRAIAQDETSAEVERDLASLGAGLLVETVDAMAAGPIPEQLQDEREATYAPRLEKGEGAVDWDRSALHIHNQIRGLHPWPHAFSELDGQRCILLRSEVSAEPHPSAHLAGRRPGEIVEPNRDRLEVVTGDGVLRLLTLQAEGGRALTAREFVAGRRLAPGATFARSAPR